MRMMLKATFPTEVGNRVIKDGSFPKIMEATITKIKPEASYFLADKGLPMRDAVLRHARCLGHSSNRRAIVHGPQCARRNTARNEWR